MPARVDPSLRRIRLIGRVRLASFLQTKAGDALRAADGTDRLARSVLSKRFMKREIEQWECPPLRAKLSKQQCAANRKLVADAQAAEDPHAFVDGAERPLTLFSLRECVGCRGVAWWARQTGRGPVSISVTELRERHQKAAAQRRRLAG